MGSSFSRMVMSDLTSFLLASTHGIDPREPGVPMRWKVERTAERVAYMVMVFLEGHQIEWDVQWAQPLVTPENTSSVEELVLNALKLAGDRMPISDTWDMHASINAKMLAAHVNMHTAMEEARIAEGIWPFPTLAMGTAMKLAEQVARLAAEAFLAEVHRNLKGNQEYYPQLMPVERPPENDVSGEVEDGINIKEEPKFDDTVTKERRLLLRARLLVHMHGQMREAGHARMARHVVAAVRDLSPKGLDARIMSAVLKVVLDPPDEGEAAEELPVVHVMTNAAPGRGHPKADEVEAKMVEVLIKAMDEADIYNTRSPMFVAGRRAASAIAQAIVESALPAVQKADAIDLVTLGDVMNYAKLMVNGDNKAEDILLDR